MWLVCYCRVFGGCGLGAIVIATSRYCNAILKCIHMRMHIHKMHTLTAGERVYYINMHTRPGESDGGARRHRNLRD